MIRWPIGQQAHQQQPQAVHTEAIDQELGVDDAGGSGELSESRTGSGSGREKSFESDVADAVTAGLGVVLNVSIVHVLLVYTQMSAAMVIARSAISRADRSVGISARAAARA